MRAWHIRSERGCLQCCEVSLQQPLRYRWNHRGSTGVIHCHCRSVSVHRSCVLPWKHRQARKVLFIQTFHWVEMLFYKCASVCLFQIVESRFASIFISTTLKQSWNCKRTRLPTKSNDFPPAIPRRILSFSRTSCGQMVCF